MKIISTTDNNKIPMIPYLSVKITDVDLNGRNNGVI